MGDVGVDILNGDHLDNLAGALAGDGSNGGKAEGGGVAHHFHALLSRECHMPPKDRRASGEDKG